MRYSYKKSLEYSRRMKFFRGAPAAAHPPFKPKSEAAQALAADSPVPYDAPLIVYDADDDDTIDKFHRARGMKTPLISLSPNLLMSLSSK